MSGPSASECVSKRYRCQMPGVIYLKFQQLRLVNVNNAIRFQNAVCDGTVELVKRMTQPNGWPVKMQRNSAHVRRLIAYTMQANFVCLRTIEFKFKIRRRIKNKKQSNVPVIIV